MVSAFDTNDVVMVVFNVRVRKRGLVKVTVRKRARLRLRQGKGEGKDKWLSYRYRSLILIFYTRISHILVVSVLIIIHLEFEAVEKFQK